MLKKLFIAALVAVALPLMAQAQSLKFGYVDRNAIGQVMPEFKTAQDQLEKLQTEQETKLKPIAEAAQKAQDEYQNASAADKEAKRKAFEDVATRYQNQVQLAQNTLQQQQQTLMGDITKKLNDAITKVGAAGGYTAIFDVDTLPYYGNGIEDVTPKVKAQLGIK